MIDRFFLATSFLRENFFQNKKSNLEQNLPWDLFRLSTQIMCSMYFLREMNYSRNIFNFDLINFFFSQQHSILHHKSFTLYNTMANFKLRNGRRSQLTSFDFVRPLSTPLVRQFHEFSQQNSVKTFFFIKSLIAYLCHFTN